MDLTHFNLQGEAHMVDVGDKATTHRIAVAAGEIHMQAATLALIVSGGHKKGDVLGIARAAGIMAAKKKEIQNITVSGLNMDLNILDPQQNKLQTLKLSLPPERKKGIILKGSHEEIAKQLVTIIREEEKII